MQRYEEINNITKESKEKYVVLQTTLCKIGGGLAGEPHGALTLFGSDTNLTLIAPIPFVNHAIASGAAAGYQLLIKLGL